MQSDWDASAEAWIESLKAGGDFSRVAVLDRPMLAAVRASAAQRVLDVGCGLWRGAVLPYDGRDCAAGGGAGSNRAAVK